MKIEDKNKALAELMGIKLNWDNTKVSNLTGINERNYRPYTEWEDGRSQFVAILLKHVHVFEDYKSGVWTQEKILDEILKMEGKWKE